MKRLTAFEAKESAKYNARHRELGAQGLSFPSLSTATYDADSEMYRRREGDLHN